MYLRQSKIIFIFFILVGLFIFISGCSKSGLVPGESGELTEHDLQLDKYYQALKWRNNMIENIMANILLMPIDEQRAWINRADPLKDSSDVILSGWKMAIDSANYEDLNANRDKFKSLKNEFLDLLFDIGEKIG